MAKIDPIDRAAVIADLKKQFAAVFWNNIKYEKM